MLVLRLDLSCWQRCSLLYSMAIGTWVVSLFVVQRVIKLPIWGWIKQYKCMVTFFWGFPWKNTALCWVGSIMTPVVVVACCLLLVACCLLLVACWFLHSIQGRWLERPTRTRLPLVLQAGVTNFQLPLRRGNTVEEMNEDGILMGVVWEYYG